MYKVLKLLVHAEQLKKRGHDEDDEGIEDGQLEHSEAGDGITAVPVSIDLSRNFTRSFLYSAADPVARRLPGVLARGVRVTVSSLHHRRETMPGSRWHISDSRRSNFSPHYTTHCQD